MHLFGGHPLLKEWSNLFRLKYAQNETFTAQLTVEVHDSLPPPSLAHATYVDVETGVLFLLQQYHVFRFS